MVFSNNLLMGAASSTGGGVAAYVPKGAVWVDGAADYLKFTPGSTTGNKKFTYSCWFKLSQTGVADNGSILDAWTDNNNRSNVTIQDTGKVDLLSDVSGSRSLDLNTTQQLRDPTAWMHFVLVVDTTVAAPGPNSIEIFLNGETVTAFGDQTYPSQNYVTQFFTSGTEMHIGINNYDDTPIHFFNGYMSEVILLDEYAGRASDFGTENSDGVWIPKDPTDIVTAQKGTSGCWLDFADSADLGNDVSGNNNDWTLVSMAAANWSYDRPADKKSTTTGNLGTWNPLQSDSDMTLAEGNTKVTGSSGGGILTNTMYVDAEDANGYYYRCLINTSNDSGYPLVGIHNTGPLGPTFVGGNASNNGWSISCGTGSNSGKPFHGSGTGGTSLFTFSSGDYVDICIKAGKLYFGQDGTWSGDPDAETGEAFSGITGLVTPAISNYDGGTAGVSTLDILGGTAPSGAKRFATYDLPAPTVTDPSLNFLPMLYEGNGGGQRVGNFIPFTDAYTVDDSARFDNTTNVLTRTPSASNRKTWTFSTWIKRSGLPAPSGQMLLGCFDGSGYGALIQFADGAATDQQIVKTADVETSGVLWSLATAAYYTDTSNWMHICIAMDTTQSTEADRTQIYINGVNQTNFYSGASSYPAQDTEGSINTAAEHYIGNGQSPHASRFQGYMAETVFIDGTALAASSFGQTDTSTNRWIPKDVSGLTFGTEGYYLNFSDSAELGDDTSGNTNDWAENNMDATNQTVDTPTQNYATLNPWIANGSDIALSEGNLIATGASGNWGQLEGTLAITEGTKGYYEVKISATGTANIIGWGESGGRSGTGGQSFSEGDTIAFQPGSDALYTGTASTASWASYSASADDVLMFAYDATDIRSVKFWFGEGGTWFQSGDPAAGTNAAVTYDLTAGTIRQGPWVPYVACHTVTDTFNFGSSASGFTHTAPTDFLPLNQDNLAENTAGITGLAWIKNRDATDFHIWFDRARGIYNYLRSSNASGNTTDGYANQATNASSVQRFLQQGVQISDMDQVNTSAESYVLWNWANDGAATANTDGTITGGSTVRVNSDTKFSIVTYTGSGANPTTVGHGLGVKPDFIVLKGVTRASGTDGWYCYHSSIGETAAIFLDLGDAAATNAVYWNNTEPTSTVWSMQADTGMNQSASTYVAYCWAGVDGYSKFGSYTGNQATDGPFVYFGFAPTWVMIKESDASGSSWHIYDNKRRTYNPNTVDLNANLDVAESYNTAAIDLLGNGLKIRNSGTGINESGKTYIYAAFAENPFGGSGVAQAKAR